MELRVTKFSSCYPSSHDIIVFLHCLLFLPSHLLHLIPLAAMHLARNAEVAQLLINAKADVFAADKGGDTRCRGFRTRLNCCRQPSSRLLHRAQAQGCCGASSRELLPACSCIHQPLPGYELRRSSLPVGTGKERHHQQEAQQGASDAHN